MDEVELKHAETELFLEALFQRHGYDFRGYARASMRRRVEGLRTAVGVERISDLVPWIMHEPGALQRSLSMLSVPVTEMFRDPEVFRYLREEVISRYADFVQRDGGRLWQAGCATGEEAYTLAILVHEAGLADRVQIYATDINEAALSRAEEGIYPLDRMKLYAANYQKAGGTRSFSDYYTARFGGGLLSQALRDSVYFSRHNLVTDSSFNAFHMIFCRNVLIYFDLPLRERVLDLFRDSLVPGGHLCLGNREVLRGERVAHGFAPVSEAHRVYRYTGDEGTD